MTNEERFNALPNSCRNPRAVYTALVALGNAGVLGKLREGAAKVEKGSQP